MKANKDIKLVYNNILKLRIYNDTDSKIGKIILIEELLNQCKTINT